MGMLLILLGLAAAAVVADFVVENDLASAPNQPFNLFGGSFDLSVPEVALAAAILGLLSVMFVILGLGLLRGSWGRRRALKHRVAGLERENSDLRSQAHLVSAVGTQPPDERQQGASEER